jgi:hypothetical protein
VALRALVSCLVGFPLERVLSMKSISWNRRAVEQAKAQGRDNPQHTICPKCGTNPQLRQFGQYQCECGDLEGFATEG